jgi:hypothetical protein
VFLVTTGGGEMVDRKALEDGTFGAVVMTEVQNQSRDMNAIIKFLLQSGQPPGTSKTHLSLRRRPKADLKPGTCWDVKALQAARTTYRRRDGRSERGRFRYSCSLYLTHAAALHETRGGRPDAHGSVPSRASFPLPCGEDRVRDRAAARSVYVAACIAGTDHRPAPPSASLSTRGVCCDSVHERARGAVAAASGRTFGQVGGARSAPYVGSPTPRERALRLR